MENEITEEKPNRLIKFIKELIPYVVIILIVILIRTYLVTPIQVDGSSMNPTLTNKEVLILKKYEHSFKRFDVIVFNNTFSNRNERLIKRVIGLPGEHVEYIDNKLYINGKHIKENFKRNSETNDFKLESIDYDIIPEGYYFVMGDNRKNSTDSRVIGLISKEQIQGSTNFSVYPFDNFGKINK